MTVLCMLLTGTAQLSCVCPDRFVFIRPAYERIIRELSIRPLKVQAGRNVVIKLQEGITEPEKVHMTDAAVDAA